MNKVDSCWEDIKSTWEETYHNASMLNVLPPYKTLEEMYNLKEKMENFDETVNEVESTVISTMYDNLMQKVRDNFDLPEEFTIETEGRSGATWVANINRESLFTIVNNEYCEFESAWRDGLIDEGGIKLLISVQEFVNKEVKEHKKKVSSNTLEVLKESIKDSRSVEEQYEDFGKVLVLKDGEYVKWKKGG